MGDICEIGVHCLAAPEAGLPAGGGPGRGSMDRSGSHCGSVWLLARSLVTET
jgi:hypothetical protein